MAAAQVPLPAPTAPSDTVRLVQILKGNSLREKIVDTTSFQTIAGDVALRESLTMFTCDSAAINKTTNVLEAFGNIHINQQDSIHTYAQYLKYIGKERMAYLKKGVRLTDKKGTLFTDELDYSLKTNIGNYYKGGRVVNGKTTLTSIEGTYYADTKDVYFKKNVRLTDPKYNIATDSLLYNTQSQVVTFITQTHIVSKDGGDIYTSSGTYDLKNGKAYFGNRTVFKDSTRTYVADNVALDEKTQTAQLEGNAVVRDSANGYTVIGGQIFANQNNKTFLATRKPVLIFKGEGDDSTFIAADTLFSGVIKKDSTGKTQLIQADTLKQTAIVTNGSTIIVANDSSAKNETSDSLSKIQRNGSLLVDTASSASKSSIEKDALPPNLDTAISIGKAPLPQANKAKLSKKDALGENDGVITTGNGSIAAPPGAATAIPLEKDTFFNLSKDTTIRFFQAFHHVRIFNDSMQAVCDSLFYSSEDSTFRLYNNPFVFSNKSQISGDTIYLYTKNKKASRAYVFYNGMLVSEVNKRMYNQISGRTLNGYFKSGAIDYVRAKGSPAESVFYPQDDDSAITGMNRCKGDVIDVYFENKEVNKVKFVNEVDGALYPINQVPEGEKLLPLFKWEDARRPKNKLELFE